MLGVVVQYVIREPAGVHWEAVLITAVPAAIAAVAAVIAAAITKRNHAHLEAIDEAVNGIEPGVPTLREKVEAVAAVVGEPAAPEAPSMRENVEALLDRKDMNPDAPASSR